MTQVKTLPHEGAELKRKAGVVSGQFLLYQEMHLRRQGEAQPELNSRGWQRLLGGLSHHLGRAVGTFLGCERSSQQWDLSELHWCASLIFIFTCHWPRNISVSVDTVPCSQLSQLLIARTEGGTALLEGWSQFEVLTGPVFFLACTRALEGSSEMFPRVCNGPSLQSTSAWPISRVPVQWVMSWKEYTKEVALVSPAPFLQPLRVARTAYRRISASRSEVLLQKWLRSLLNKLADEVWCIKSYGSSLEGNYITSVMMDKITTDLNKHSTSHQEFTSMNESCSTESCNPLHSRLPQDWTPKCSLGAHHVPLRPISLLHQASPCGWPNLFFQV